MTKSTGPRVSAALTLRDLGDRRATLARLGDSESALDLEWPPGTEPSQVY